MQRLTTPLIAKPTPQMVVGFAVCVSSLEHVVSPELMNSVASYWYWFSHGVPLADA